MKLTRLLGSILQGRVLHTSLIKVSMSTAIETSVLRSIVKEIAVLRTAMQIAVFRGIVMKMSMFRRTAMEIIVFRSTGIEMLEFRSTSIMNHINRKGNSVLIFRLKFSLSTLQ